MALAVLCGGVIGIEREHKRRPAGFRTHILICVGAAMTTLTSQYLVLVLHLYTDLARLGAQVIAGIGFIGAGAIIVTRHRRVKGLTTAAGLWVAAIVGLACGAGFYEGALLATGLVLLAELVFSRLEYRIIRNLREVNLYVEYDEKRGLDEMLTYLRAQNVKVLDLEITRAQAEDNENACALFSLQLTKTGSAEELIRHMVGLPAVEKIEKL